MVRLTNGGISIEGGPEMEFSLESEGEPESQVEKVHLHAHDAAVRAMQAFRDGKHPDECDGLGIAIDWEGAVAGEYDREGED